MDIVILFVSFVTLLVLGVSVASCMLLSSALVLIVSGMPFSIIAERLAASVNSYTLMAVPFFILAAVIMNKAGVTERLLKVASCLVGRATGATAQINILGSVFFAGMSGSATADVASQGRMLIPQMIREGYDRQFAAGVTAAASITSAIIPPSIIMIIYGSVTSVSIGQLFFAGIIPGLLMALTLMTVAAILSVRRKYPRGSRVSLKETGRVIYEALPALFAPVIILGGIRFGIFTPTEAGVIACVYGAFLGLCVYRCIAWRELPTMLVEAVEATAIPVYVIASSAVFGFVLTMSGFGFVIEDAMRLVTSNPTIFLLIALSFIFIVGLFVESTSALLIFIPMLAPIADSYGINSLHFAILTIMVLMIGTMTPPVGLQSFIAADIARIPITAVTIWPFVFALAGLVTILVFIPDIILILPSILR